MIGDGELLATLFLFTIEYLPAVAIVLFIRWATIPNY